MLVAFVAALAIAGCGGDGGDEASGDTTETSETTDPTAAETTTTTLSPEAEVEAAIAAYYAMFERVVQAPDPNDPEIAQRTTGASRQRVEETFAQYAGLGQVGQLGPTMSEAVLGVGVTGDQATAEVCAVDDSVLVDAASGRMIDADVVTRRVEMQLQRVDGAWLVADVLFTDSWEGVRDCA